MNFEQVAAEKEDGSKGDPAQSKTKRGIQEGDAGREPNKALPRTRDSDQEGCPEMTSEPKPPKHHDFNLVVAALSVLVLAFQTVIIWRQANIMDKQRQEMVTAGEQTDAIKCALQSSAEAAQDSAGSMRKTAEYTRGTLEQNKKTLAKTIEMSRSDQRARIGIASINGSMEIKEGSVLAWDVVWQNFGKTQAQNVDCATGVRFLRSGEPFVPVYEPDPSGTRSVAIFWPGVTLTTPTPSPVFTKQHAEGIGNGTEIMYLYGRSSYDDGFGKQRNTTFACRYVRGQSRWRLHDTYNKAD